MSTHDGPTRPTGPGSSAAAASSQVTVVTAIVLVAASIVLHGCLVDTHGSQTVRVEGIPQHGTTSDPTSAATPLGTNGDALVVDRYGRLFRVSAEGLVTSLGGTPDQIVRAQRGDEPPPPEASDGDG